jgi:hypothetical protein
MSRATVDLPQPDSPTSPSVSPGSIARLTPSTAFSTARGFRSRTRSSQGGETSNERATSGQRQQRPDVILGASQHAGPGAADRLELGRRGRSGRCALHRG